MRYIQKNYTKDRNIQNSNQDAYFARQISLNLADRSDLHIARKLWHIVTGMTFVGAYLTGIVSKTNLLVFLSLVFIATFIVEKLRLKNKEFNQKVVKAFGPIIRSQEVSKMSGIVYYVGAAIFVISVFPKPVAILSLIYLALGDPIASFMGIITKKNGIYLLPGKTIQGTGSGFLVCALATWFYLKSLGFHGVDHIRLTLLGGFAFSLAEVLPLDMDDNFTIPIVSGFILWLGFILIQFA